MSFRGFALIITVVLTLFLLPGCGDKTENEAPQNKAPQNEVTQNEAPQVEPAQVSVAEQSKPKRNT